MTATVFESPHPYVGDRIHAAAVYCSDGRYGENFDDFVYDHLKLLRYDRFAIPGGPASLAQGDEPYGSVARSHLELLIDVHQLTRIALIQHHDCAYYLGKLGVDRAELKARQTADLARVAEYLSGFKSSLQIEGYLAVLAGEAHDRVVFQQVSL